jgi:TetR/AcrR family transcriptional repressor of bet genes
MIAARRAARPERPRDRSEAKIFYRQTIIEATIRAIARHGFAGVSVSRLMHYSGLSRGMVNLYFVSKESLLFEVLRHLARSYRASWQGALAAAGASAKERLWAIIEHDIDRGAIDQDWLVAWLSYRREAISRPNYRPYCDPREAGFHRAVLGACRDLVIEGDYPIKPQDAALAIVYLLEGLWIDWALNPKRFRRWEARAVCQLTLHGLFPAHFAPAGANSA